MNDELQNNGLWWLNVGSAQPAERVTGPIRACVDIEPNRYDVETRPGEGWRGGDRMLVHHIRDGYARITGLHPRTERRVRSLMATERPESSRRLCILIGHSWHVVVLGGETPPPDALPCPACGTRHNGILEVARA